MASVVLRQGSRVSFYQRWYSAAAAVPLTTPIETDARLGARKAPEDVIVSKVKGYTVASLENYSSLSSVAVFLKAGSRYETYNTQGLTHLLRRCAFGGNNDRSAFRIARETDSIGASLEATATREHLIYSSNFLRGNIPQIMDTLGSVICYPQYKPWEVKDKQATLPLDLAQVQTSPVSLVLEGVHQMAFRSGLCNPLYCPTRNLSKFTSDDLQAFVKDYFNPESTVVVGIGVNHGELERAVQNSFSAENTRVNPATKLAEYVGGSELRIPATSDHTCAAFVCKGASLQGAQADLLAAGVLQQILGAEPESRIKWGSNTSARLSKAGALATDSPFCVSALNLSYSDSGLFGILVNCRAKDTGEILKAAMKEFNSVSGGNITEEELTRAKNQLKTRYLMSIETQGSLVEDIANQVSLKGSFTPLAETLAQVDKISKDDVVRFARAVSSMKGTYVSHGNLSNTPRLDQLLADILLK